MDIGTILKEQGTRSKEQGTREVCDFLLVSIVILIQLIVYLVVIGMAKAIDKYTYRVTWSEEDQEYVGLCAEFSALSWLASTQEKAFEGIKKTVRKCVTDMRRTKEEIPEPFSIRTYSGKFIVRVPPETHRMLSIQAAEYGISLNRLVSSKIQ